MTRSAAFDNASTATHILARFARSLVSLAKAFQDRQEVRNLAEFDERMLRDIGLTRGDVESALMEPVHHRPSWVLIRCASHPIQAHKPASASRARPVVPFVRRA